EEQLQESFRQVSELKSRLALANEAGGIGVWRGDLVADNDTFDARALALFGYAGGRAEPSRSEVFECLVEEDRRDFHERIEPALRGGSKQVWQCRVLLADASLRYL